MKKILSAILISLLLFSIVPFAYAEETITYNVGDIIQFGSYPQSEVTDTEIVAALNKKAPVWDNWTSYGYYRGSRSVGTMRQGDWMRYTDVTYNGDKYRGVKFTLYRPVNTCAYCDELESYQDDNGYRTNTVYWFKFEPIDWRVLNPATGLVISETIIDSQAYSNTVYSYYSESESTHLYFNDASYTNYANDYETSSIRKWLNEDFFNIAFTDSEKEEIYSTTLNNDGCHTLVGNIGFEDNDSSLTRDKIFLLSYDEVLNSSFGFDSKSDAYDKARQTQGSDYAKCQGLEVSTNSSYYGTSDWYLRSPGDFSFRSCFVYFFGVPDNRSYIYACDVGIRPALRCSRIFDINQPEHQHSYKNVDTPPTCIAKGYTTYTCICGDNYTVKTLEALGHDFDGSKCRVCGYDRADNCDCKCHKGGISGFFFKIINLFQKLFGINKVCGCGAKH